MKLAILSVVTGTLLISCIAADCDKGFFGSGSSCYVVLDEICPWIVAVNYCSAFGMNLAVVEDSTENQFLKEYLTNNTAKYHRATDVWIGGSNILGGTWVWSAVGQTIESFFWGPGEPNASSGSEHCLSLFQREGYAWNDEHCSYNGYPLCEKPLL